jgi:hypothetical protein
MEFSIIPDKEALNKCAWCQSEITDHMEVYGLGAKLKPNIDLSEYEGHCIEIDLASEDMSVYMMVTGRGSEAKNEGKDAMFLVCSENCAKKLKDVLEKEISSGEIFKTVVND